MTSQFSACHVSSDGAKISNSVEIEIHKEGKRVPKAMYHRLLYFVNENIKYNTCIIYDIFV